VDLRGDSGERCLKTTTEEGIEPGVTIDSGEIPRHRQSLQVDITSAFTSERPPRGERRHSSRMPDSKGELEGGRSVKVDKPQPISLKDPPRTWIWAHVTVVD
jgi:hypothetical protein